MKKPFSLNNRKKGHAAIFLVLTFFFFTIFGCKTQSNQQNLSGDRVFEFGGAKTSLKIVSGSENRILEPILETFSKEKKINLAIDYQGSLDIMRLLEQETVPYDAVWPASSLWISVGDTRHRVKHLSSTSITPVVFGIRESLAKELNFIDRDVKVRDILDAIEAGKLKFTMTSATQSNSGASAYIGFLYALMDNPDVITAEALDDPQLKEDIRKLLNGIERSSGSSDWLKDLFLQGDYDAMVNYEALIISANQILEKEGRETLHVIYPIDGLTIADSPLGFISSNNQPDRNESEQEKAFLELQNYLLSDKVQASIQQTGRRTGYGTLANADKKIFRKEWGIDTDRILSTINMPKSDVLLKALNAYQNEFKKPGYNIYCLDFSGSMASGGSKQLLEALTQVMEEKNAAVNFLQASQDEVNEFIIFSESIRSTYKATGPVELEALLPKIQAERATGGTAIYLTVAEALDKLNTIDRMVYSPSIILMTDGENNGQLEFRDFEKKYQASGSDIPVFPILFGSANEDEMDQLASLTRSRVFDGRKDLVNAFKTVRGYN